MHRLDKDTSGLLLVARSRLAAAKYSALFAQKASKGVEKCYLAVVSGVPKVASGRIKGGLKKEWRDGVEKVVNLPTAGEGAGAFFCVTYTHMHIHTYHTRHFHVQHDKTHTL